MLGGEEVKEGVGRVAEEEVKEQQEEGEEEKVMMYDVHIVCQLGKK